VKKKTASVKIRKEVKTLSQRATAVPGQCRCGHVRVEIDFPARWAIEAQAARDAIELDHRDELVDWRDEFDLA
jgi:hypothetical protein